MDNPLPIESKAMSKTGNLSGFTLLEVSIVLIIIGLITGGVVAGRFLIRSAELRSILTERDKYETAVNTFQIKYSQLPGDMPNAYSFWGSGCGTDSTTADTGCNGNGDGRISLDGENLKAWEHLSLSGLIAGKFNGVSGAGGTGALTLDNIPKSAFPQTYWSLGDDVCDGSIPNNNFNAILAIGGSRDGESSCLTSIPSLSPQEALALDQKTDDGRANSGKMYGNTLEFCHDSDSDYYQAIMAPDARDCVLHFILK